MVAQFLIYVFFVKNSNPQSQKDGYCEVKDDDGRLYKIVYEYNGCRYHKCTHGCMESLQTDSQFLESRRRYSQILQEVDEIREMSSCEWAKIKRSPLYREFLENNRVEGVPTTEEDLLKEILDGSFYGIAKGRAHNIFQ